MREVSAKQFEFIRRTFVRLNLDVEGALEGLDLAQVDTQRHGERVDWDELSLFVERAYAGMDDEAIIRSGETYIEGHDWLQMLARVTLTPRLLHLIVWEMTPMIYPFMDVQVDIREEPVRVEILIPGSYRGTRELFLGTVGEMRYLNSLMGYPPAEVEYDCGTHHGFYEITIGEPARLRDRIAGMGREAIDWVSREVVRMIERSASADFAPIAGRAPTVLELQRHRGFTRAEARVTRRLIEGATVREIAQELGISQHTVRSHLRSLFDKTGARSQAALVSHVLLREDDAPRT